MLNFVVSLTLNYRGTIPLGFCAARRIHVSGAMGDMYVQINLVFLSLLIGVSWG